MAGKMRPAPVVAVALLVVLALSGSLRAAAFRDLEWGDPPSKLANATKFADYRGIVSYVRPDESRALGSLPVTGISYMFFEDELMGVVIISPDQAAMDRTLVAKYGNPDGYPFDDSYSHKWTTDDTLVTFKRDAVTGGATASLFGLALLAKYNDWQSEQAKSNAAAW